MKLTEEKCFYIKKINEIKDALNEIEANIIKENSKKETLHSFIDEINFNKKGKYFNFCTVDQAAAQLGVGEHAVRKALKKKKIKGFQLGYKGRWQIPWEEVEKLAGRFD